ncbi:MAG: methyltransferase domain-containing protein [Anaerolineae bacterium]|nr:methyltransferase domain-containing protein [Anaerolineae bacterium]
MNSKILSRERFTQYAEVYVTSKAHAQGSELERLVDIARPQPDWNVLDVATGGGHTALAFAPHVARVAATDVTPRMLEKAEAYVTSQGVTNVEFKPADAMNLPFADATFELVTCRIAPHHFIDCARFVHESARVLRAGGLLLVQDHVLPDDEESARAVDDFERLRDPSHNRAFNDLEWQGMFEETGLRIEHTEQIVKRHEFIPWAQRQGCTPEVIAQLIAMMQQAPAAARDWMQPQGWGTPEATFANHHIIIAGRKGAQ